jgi:hypothetical protein
VNLRILQSLNQESFNRAIHQSTNQPIKFGISAAQHKHATAYELRLLPGEW